MNLLRLKSEPISKISVAKLNLENIVIFLGFICGGFNERDIVDIAPKGVS